MNLQTVSSRGLLLILVLLILTSSPVLAKTVYVKTTGSDLSDGSTWDLAKQTVQAGLNASAYGDQVWVAAGTYVQCITLTAGVGLYGGFPANGGDWSARNTTANPTILDGNKAGCVVTSPSGATSTTVIDGFTVRNGTAFYGGGIYCNSSSPTITNNSITANTSTTGNGGGVYCSLSSSATISNNTIARNRDPGVYCSHSSPTIFNNAITGNGGGIVCFSSSAAISNNTIAANISFNGCGGIYCSASSTAMSNNIVAFNSSGIYATGTCTLRNNCVYNPDGYNYSGGTSPGAGDVQTDPKLESVAYGRVHIQPDSPCIDAGLDSVVQPGWVDIDGQARVQPVPGGTVDIGADESDGTTWNFTPSIIRVTLTGNDANDGSGWDDAHAKKTIQAGMDAAASVGGEVWVKAGVYNGCIILDPYSYLYGGFAGTEAARSQRDWKTNQTILDGQKGGSVVSANSGFRVSAIDGFVVRNGSASEGAGISCIASPIISNDTITGNTSSYGGGGISCGSASPVISNNCITGNTATYGGGIWSANASYTIIINNLITGNSAMHLGGGIYNDSSSPSISNNTITGNLAADGGGAIRWGSASSAAISNNIIAFNSSGIYADGTCTLRNNCVYNPDGYNYSGTSAGAGDIQTDPKLEAVAYGRVHIQPGSPCIDAGLDSVVQPGWVDIDGQPRVQPVPGGTVDIGADESDGTTWSFTPAIIRVTLTGNDANDGSGWDDAHAKKTVQAGMDAAASVGGEVWVKAGVYNGCIILDPYSYLYGGFAGTEAARSQRHWKTNQTILDGQKGGSVVSANCGFHVSGIDGFVIGNGAGTVVNGTSFGGGIYCSSSSPTISNDTVHGNGASSGGGVYCYYSSPTITNDTITGNTAGEGGGIYCSYSSPTITYTAITSNTALHYGGGVCFYFGSPAMSGDVIAGNVASLYGGGVYCYASSATVLNNTIVGNSAQNPPGGMYCWQSSAVISNNIVALNLSGIYVPAGTLPTLRNNCVYNPGGNNYSGVSPGTGDISADPLFVNSSSGDYHLTIESQCVNAGYNTAPGLPPTDLDGNPRMYDGTVDIGAYEFSSARQVKGLSITPGSGTYNYVLSASLACDTPGADIHFTTNGVDPARGDPEASGPVYLSNSVTLKARAWCSGWVPSTTATATYTILPLSTAKKQPVFTTVTIPAAVVTAVVNSTEFYVEADDRSSGILVSKGVNGLTPGKRVTVVGTARVMTRGEKYVNATSVTDAGTGTIGPLVLNNRDVGGGNWFYTVSNAAGQKGVKDYRLVPVNGSWTPTVTDSVGLNNIGLLITTSGKVTYSTTGYFYIDDGYGVMDNSGQVGIKVMGSVPPPDPLPPGWTPVGHYVTVTGISSCFKAADPSTDLYRQIWCSQVTLAQ